MIHLIGMVLAAVDPTQITVGALATAGFVLAAWTNTRGRKQELSTIATNTLIDQLQETIITQTSDNDRMRSHVKSLDARVAELEVSLERCRRDRAELRRLLDL